MPKIRGLKPDYWTDEDIMDLSIPARLLFPGLWNYACDNGHLEDKPKQIKSRIMPGDDINIAELLRELADKGRIERDAGWITVPHLAEHQRPDKRYWLTCKKPGCCRPEGDSQPKSRSAHTVHTSGTHSAPTVSTGGAHVDGDGDGDGDGELMVSRPRKRAHSLPDDFTPTEHHYEIAAEHRVNLQHELAKFRDYSASVGWTKKDWNATFNNWIRNARPSLTSVPQSSNGTRRLPNGEIDYDYYRNLPPAKPQIP